MPVGVLEAKKESEDPLKGMQQAKGYADCQRFDVKYVFATNGHLYGEFDLFTKLQNGPFPFAGFPHHPNLTARYAKDNARKTASLLAFRPLVHGRHGIRRTAPPASAASARPHGIVAQCCYNACIMHAGEK